MINNFFRDVRRIVREIADVLYQFWNGERRPQTEKDKELFRQDEEAEAPRRSTFYQNWELELGHSLGHPWRRFLARGMDLAIYEFLWKLYQWTVMGVYSYRGTIGSEITYWDLLRERYILFAFMLVFEPFLLSLFGTTIGKWLLGLSVRGRRGGKLSYRGALQRTWDVIRYGFGFGIPGWFLYRLWESLQECRSGMQNTWEQLRRYYLVEKKMFRGGGYAICLFVLVGINLSVLLFGGRPSHRGQVTPEEYAEDVTRLAHWYGLDHNLTLGSDGKWRNAEGDVSFVRMDAYRQWTRAIGLLKYEIEEKDGYVNGVFLGYRTTGRNWIYAMTDQKAVAALSILGIQEEVSPFEWAKWCIFLEREIREQGKWQEQSFDFSIDGNQLIQEVSVDGYSYNWDFDSYAYIKTPFNRDFQMKFRVMTK